MSVNPNIMIHMSGSRIVKRVEKKVAENWKRCRHRKLYLFGLARVTVYSDFLLLTDKQKDEWVKIEFEKRNPILMEMQRVVSACYRERMNKTDK
jgi:hypothetical protein